MPLPQHLRGGEKINPITTPTYQQRHKDLVAHTIVEDKSEDGSSISIEVYGTELDGTTTWIWIHIPADCERITYVIPDTDTDA